MPRNYIRKKPDLKPMTQAQLDQAELLIKQGKSKRAAAEAVGVNESTLRKRLRLGTISTSMGRYQTTFTEEQELEFYFHCLNMDERFFGLQINDLRRLAYEYAEANKIKHRFNDDLKMAGRDWVDCFLNRHPDLAKKQSSGTSLARAIGFNKTQVDRFYNNLKEVYDKYKFQPSRIYNMDETGLSTVPKKTPKVVTKKGKKNVAKMISADRGITVTGVCCMSASGHYVPPALIYPRKKPRDDLLDGGPLQSICMVSDSGYMNTDLFLNWLNHFKYFVHPSQGDPVLLILDNHVSHISLQAVTYARNNNIIMLTLPPHGSHKLQPLDRAFFSPLKTKYYIECDKYMSRHPGRGITQYQVANLFNLAYIKVANLSNAESGFRVTGIYPFDDELFDESDFAPSLVTDMHIDEIDKPISEQIIDIDPSTSREPLVEHNEISQFIDDYINFDENPAKENCEEVIHRASPSILNQLVESSAQTPSLNDLDCGLSAAILKEKNSIEANTSPKIQRVKVVDLSPLPRLKEKKRGARTSLKSQIVTSSPYKQQLEIKKKEEEDKKGKKKVSTLDLSRKKNTMAATKQKIRKPKPSTPHKEYYCPFCQENYTEPPSEEWIECMACNEWCHEQCTAYEKGIFICDFCTEN